MINENALQELKSEKYIYDLDNNEIDIRVRGLIDNVDVRGKKVLDSSTLSGYHTCSLAQAGALVTASDIRPSNLKKALYRALYKGINGIDYRLIDLEDMHNIIKKDEFFCHYFSGSFYHLKNPIQVLKNIASLFEYTLLETHIALEGRHNPLTFKDTYKGWEYSEGGWQDPCSSKNTEKSFWLTKDSLLRLFNDCNLEIVKIIYDNEPNPHGPRFCVLLKRI